MALSTYPSHDDLKGTIRGTLLYLIVYFHLIGFQAFSKFYLYDVKKREAQRNKKNDNNLDATKPRVSFREIKYYNSRDMLALAGDRAVGNFVEQSIVFLPLLWMHAIWVNPAISWIICCIYTAVRAPYPFLYMRPPLMLLSTVPGYCVILYLMYGIAFRYAWA